MKYIFFGSPRFAKIVLEKLIAAGLPPMALVCNPDRPVGRKHVITPPETKILAMSSELRAGGTDIKILQPEKLSALSSELAALSPDFFVVAAYAKIIPQSILDIPRLGTIGVHPSLLPKYRGASPIQSALLHGERDTGVTLYKLGAGVDDGPVLGSRTLEIGGIDTYEVLERKLAELGGTMLADMIPQFMRGEVHAIPQDDAKATFTKKFETQDGFVADADVGEALCGGSHLVQTIHNKIRALGAEPGVWTIKNNKRLKLLESEIRDGKLVLRKIQWEGKKPETLQD